MFAKLLNKMKQPRKPITLSHLRGALSYLLVVNLPIFLVVTFWPERAHSLVVLSLISFCFLLVIWMDIHEQVILKETKESITTLKAESQEPE